MECERVAFVTVEFVTQKAARGRSDQLYHYLYIQTPQTYILKHTLYFQVNPHFISCMLLYCIDEIMTFWTTVQATEFVHEVCGTIVSYVCCNW